MIVSIHQPNFIPWIGFFDKINRSDQFVLLTSSKRSKSDNYLVRTKILNHSNPQYLSIPLGSHEIAINKLIMPDDDKWKTKALNIINSSYKKTNFFHEVFSDFETLLFSEYKYFYQYSINILNFLISKLNIDTIVHIDLDFDEDFGFSNQRNIAICKKLGAELYLSGNGAKSYNDIELFKRNSLDLIYQDYSQPIYNQKNSKDFIQGLSILDMLFNCGYKGTEIILKK